MDLEKRCAVAWTANVLAPYISEIASDHSRKGRSDLVWFYLSYHEHLSIDLILNNLDHTEWNWYGVSKNSNITMEIVNQNPALPWNNRGLSRNPNLTIDQVLKCLEIEQNELDWGDISSHSNITMEIIATYPDLPWDWSHGVSSNPNLTIEFIRQYICKEWQWVKISRNRGITMKMIETNPDLPWSYVGISYNSNITTDMILTAPKEELDWSGISYNNALDFNLVIGCPALPWNWRAITMHPSLTIDIVLALPHIQWNFRVLSKHKNFTMEIIKANPDLPWRWVSIAENPNLSDEFLEANYEEFRQVNALDYIGSNEGLSLDVFHNDQTLVKYISRNPNVTMEFVRDHEHFDWDWGALISHGFTVDMKYHYILTKQRRLALLSLMDEDYNREEGVLDLTNVFDLVFQNEYILSRMVEYV